MDMSVVNYDSLQILQNYLGLSQLLNVLPVLKYQNNGHMALVINLFSFLLMNDNYHPIYELKDFKLIVKQEEEPVSEDLFTGEPTMD